MNQPIRHFCLTATAACGLLLAPASAQTTATTDPVGAMTVNVPEHDGSGRVSMLVSVPFATSAEAEFIVESVSGNLIESADSTFSDQAFSLTDSNGNPLYFLEIVSSPSFPENVGLTVEILGNTTNVLTLSEEVTGMVDSGATAVIRKFSTIDSAFGSDNKFSLKSGTSLNDVDIIYLVNNLGEWKPYYYRVSPPEFGGTGWRSADDIYTDASNTRIEWNSALVSRNGATTRPELSLIFSGTVKTSQSLIAIHEGNNLISYQYPTDITLEDLFFDPNQLKKGTNLENSDVVYLTSQAGVWRPYYYRSSPPEFGGTGWRDSGDPYADKGSVPVPSGSAVFVRRQGLSSFYLTESPNF